LLSKLPSWTNAFISYVAEAHFDFTSSLAEAHFDFTSSLVEEGRV
jgi:hypothetical protein